MIPGWRGYYSCRHILFLMLTDFQGKNESKPNRTVFGKQIILKLGYRTTLHNSSWTRHCKTICIPSWLNFGCCCMVSSMCCIFQGCSKRENMFLLYSYSVVCVWYIAQLFKLREFESLHCGMVILWYIAQLFKLREFKSLHCGMVIRCGIHVCVVYCTVVQNKWILFALWYGYYVVFVWYIVLFFKIKSILFELWYGNSLVYPWYIAQLFKMREYCLHCGMVILWYIRGKLHSCSKWENIFTISAIRDITVKS